MGENVGKGFEGKWLLVAMRGLMRVGHRHEGAFGGRGACEVEGCDDEEGIMGMGRYEGQMGFGDGVFGGEMGCEWGLE